MKLLPEDDLEVDSEGFPVFMTRDDGTVIFDFAGNPKLKFARHRRYIEKHGKSKTITVSVRESNQRGGFQFKTDLIEKFRK